MFTTHRRKFLDSMDDGDIAIFPGASPAIRNHDVEYPFRQQADYWYLSGHDEPDGVLLLAKGIEGFSEDGIFVLPKDPAQETWTGIRLGPEGAKQELGFSSAWNLDELETVLTEALQQARRVWYRLGENQTIDSFLVKQLSSMRMKTRLGIHPPEALLEPTHVLHEMRLHKSEAEVEVMRKAAALSVEGHIMAMAQTSPGMGEWELQALCDYTFRRGGGSGWAYPAIVAGGANACILHYNTNQELLKDGDLLLLDAGAEYGCYAGDITRTFPVNGKYTPAQRDVYEVVFAAQAAAIEKCRPGTIFGDIHATAVAVLSEGLRTLGVLKQSVDEIVAEELYRPWYMHQTSHWIGLDVHDAGRYRNGDNWRPLAAGMALTVEPGLYFASDDERVPAPLRGMGIRIEDDILITPGGHENLTLAAPKTIEDVEAACSAERAMPATIDAELMVK
ncbi:MAG: Xaa-Pro aminopeptidase [Planctomycetota bacterium]|nr:MAG: Xaa-Pro aminopeptidase [Planctomycetota bacterium]